jgi:hypothetical protein
MYFGENPTFLGNILLPSSGPKIKTNKKPAETAGKLSSAFHLLLMVSYFV